MPRLSQNQKTELELRPEVQARLNAMLDTYFAVKSQLEQEKAAIEAYCAEEGVEKAKLEEASVYFSRGGTSTKLHKEKLIAQGVTLAQIEAATVTKPKKDSFTIRGKSEKAADSEE